VTLYDYLGTIEVDEEPIIWSSNPLTQSQVDAAAGKPYIYVEEMDEIEEVALYGSQRVLEQYVDVYIYQSFLKDGRTPVRHKAMQVYFTLFDAPKYVNKGIYGQPLIDLHVDAGVPPNYDKDSAGLAGMIRFRLLTPRG
jgi:hypothetical protein